MLGFVLLFAINLAVEFLLFPALNLDNTDKNDIYFKVWWLVVAAWFLAGLSILQSFEKSPAKE